MFGSLSSLAGALLLLRQKKYAAHFGYSRRSDYAYRFDPEATRSVTVHISEGSFPWPSEASGADTAFLAVGVRSRGTGWLVDPAVLVEQGDLSLRQYVERSARGVRYVNVSPVALRGPAPGSEVRLSGSHLSVADGPAELLLMENRPVTDGPVLVVSPHPDDAEITSFGLYSGSDAWVVTVTAGEVGTHSLGGLLEPTPEGHRLRGRLRAWESITAPFIGGVPPERAINLGYFDGTLQRMYERRDTPVTSETAHTDKVSLFRQHNLSEAVPPAPEEATWGSLIADLSALIEHIAPSLVVAPHPLLDSHPDHKYLGFAVAEAVSQSSASDGDLLLYSVYPPGHGEGALVHPVGPRDGIVSLPPLHTDVLLCHKVYSHPVDGETQARKVFAMDVFRDIREQTFEQPGSVARVAYSSLREVYRKMVVYDGTFLRKHVRPNELFYVIPHGRVAAMFEVFAGMLDEELETP